jgi:hypothetical protein
MAQDAETGISWKERPPSRPALNARAPRKELQEKCGFTLENIVAAAKLQIVKAR